MRRARLALLGIALLFALVSPGRARLGGGQTYSGSGGGGSSYSGSSGGSRSYSGGGGGSIEGMGMLVGFALQRFDVTLPLVSLLVFLGHAGSIRRSRGSRSAPTPSVPTTEIRSLDPDFSRVVFLDMADSLVTRAMAARGHGDWAPLRPYLEPEAREQLQRDHGAFWGKDPLEEVRDIVLGGIRVVGITCGPEHQELAIEVRTNFVEVRGGSTEALATRERWTFRRAAGTRSPPPEVARTLGCPSCGAPVELTETGRCTHCDSPADRSDLAWRVASREVLERRPRGRPVVSPGGREVGLELPTRRAPDLPEAVRALEEQDPGFSVEDLEARMSHCFHALQEAWSQGDRGALRAYETLPLYRAHRLWLERYEEAGLRNVLEDIELERVELVRLELDRYYQAATARLRARMFDYTLDGSGRLVGGSRDLPRRFSEYWTFVRRADCQGEAEPADSCPACGAPRDQVGPTGICGYCDALVADGAFGWVLAFIEQDEEYGG